MRLYPSGSSSTPWVLVETLKEGRTTSVPPPPQPSTVRGAAHRRNVRLRARRGKANDIAALQGTSWHEGGAPPRWIAGPAHNSRQATSHPERRIGAVKPHNVPQGGWVTCYSCGRAATAT